MPYGVNAFDEPYQILNGMFPESAPYSPLSAYFTKWFGELFNWQWLYFRYLAFSLNALSILISGCYLYIKSHKYAYSLIVTCLALLVGTIIPNIYNIYGWDDWTQFFLIITTLLILNYAAKPDIAKVILIAFLSATIILIRIPSIVILPLVCVCILFFIPKLNSAQKTYHIFTYVLTTIILILTFIILTFGSLEGYIEAFRANPMDDHKPLRLLSAIILSGLNSLVWSIFIVGCYSIMKRLVHYSERRIYLYLFFVAIPIIILWFLYFYNDPYYFLCIYLGVGILTFLLSKAFLIKNLTFKASKRIVIIILFLALVPIIGTNIGVAKITVWTAFPLIALYIYPYVNKYFNYLIITLCLSIVASCYFKLKFNTFYDEGYKHTTYQFSEGKMKGLFTTPKKGEKIQKVIESFSKYSNDNNNSLILRIGANYLYEYLFQSHNDYAACKFSFFDIYFNQDYIAWVEKQIVNSDKPVVVLYQKHDTFETADIPLLPMLQMIQNYLKPVEDIDGFLIYASSDAIVEDVYN